MNAADIISACINQVGTDASRATILTLLQEAYDSQLAESRWFRTQASIGTTVSGTAEYVIPDDVVEAYFVTVGGYRYTAIGEDVMIDLASGYSTGYGYLFSQGYDASGNTTVTLFPTPTTTGTDIQVYAARQGLVLADSPASTPITPRDAHGSLIEGTAALIFERIDEREDLAAPFQAKFAAATEDLRRRKNSLLRGGGPARLLVQGIHWR